MTLRRGVSRLELGWALCLAAALILTGWQGAAHVEAQDRGPSEVSQPWDDPIRPEVHDQVQCRKAVELLEQQKSLISREAGQIRRELAVLREELAKPGLGEIFAGIGYIFGLAGIGLYVHSRRSRKTDGNGG